MWMGGTAIDRIYKAGKWKLSRKLPAMLGFGLAAATLLPAPFMRSPGWFIACFALTTFGVYLTVTSSWPVCCDVGGRYSGTLSAAMNTMGALGSLSLAAGSRPQGWAETGKGLFLSRRTPALYLSGQLLEIHRTGQEPSPGGEPGDGAKNELSGTSESVATQIYTL
jgi:hypothetical protein